MVLTLLALVPSRAATLSLAPIADATLCESADGGLANGSGSWLFAGRTQQADGPIRRALLRFDPSALPPGARVLDARLIITVDRVNYQVPTVDLTLHRAEAAWTEGGSDPIANEGICAPARFHDATWIHVDWPVADWAAPGGDFDPQAQSRVTVHDLGAYTFASTPALVAQVQAWVDDPATNHGWLVQGDESVGGTSTRFVARTGAGAPQLVVDYAPPGPALAAPIPGIAGTDNVFAVTRGAPFTDTVLMFALQPGSTPVPGCPGVQLELGAPGIAARADTDALGEVDLSVFVPQRAGGRTAWFQAVQLAGCAVSNAVVHTF